MRAGGVLKTLGNPFATRSAFSRSNANLFGKTFRVGTILRATSACSATVGARNPNPSPPTLCARKQIPPSAMNIPTNKKLSDFMVQKSTNLGALC
jgi:hypothetical protein